jgi:hypothetical protein
MITVFGCLVFYPYFSWQKLRPQIVEKLH